MDEYDRIFKDDLAEDIATFLNVEEFSEVATIDGVELTCQVAAHTADKSNRQNETYDGLHGDFITVYFDAEIYKERRERLPRHGEWILINQKRYDVISAKNEMGIVKITCSAYRQNTLRTMTTNSPFGGA